MQQSTPEMRLLPSWCLQPGGETDSRQVNAQIDVHGEVGCLEDPREIDLGNFVSLESWKERRSRMVQEKHSKKERQRTSQI